MAIGAEIGNLDKGTDYGVERLGRDPLDPAKEVEMLLHRELAHKAIELRADTKSNRGTWVNNSSDERFATVIRV